jgi:murein DD-endopeptidase MepM/ murein hydrolase activator NlpD
VKLPENLLRRFGPRPTSHSFFWQRGLNGQEAASFAARSSTNSKVTATIERVWAWIHETFPERQIYIRSDGRVQFFTFGPTLQATLAGLSLIFLGWVAFATVNVIFKDRIITAKDHRYQEMQAAYETRLTNLQISYDELNGALVNAEDKFKVTADTLATKQNAIANFLNRKTQMEAAIGADHGGVALPAEKLPYTSMDGASMDDASVPASTTPEGAQDNLDGDANAGGTLTVMPEPVQPQPRIAKPLHANLLDQTFAKLRHMASAVFQPAAPTPAAMSEAYTDYPGLRELAGKTARLAKMANSETLLMDKTRDALIGDVAGLHNMVKATGINPAKFEQRIEANEGVGGPEIPLDRVEVDGLNDQTFNSAYLEASAVLNQLGGLSREMRHIPLSLPVNSTDFDLSSGFGPRLDPFTGHYAFHSGMDFAGPWGTAVTATAAGTVIFAGTKGGYGNMVEIDHGMGLHTRYGHLSRITVRLGMRVEKGAAIGRVGSTGRSTGPHVHYEVWYDDVVRNPRNFIEAGRHVL